MRVTARLKKKAAVPINPPAVASAVGAPRRTAHSRRDPWNRSHRTGAERTPETGSYEPAQRNIKAHRFAEHKQDGCGGRRHSQLQLTLGRLATGDRSPKRQDRGKCSRGYERYHFEHIAQTMNLLGKVGP